MKPRIIVFVDHEIGHRLLAKMTSGRDTFPFEMVAVVTTLDNGNRWWPGVDELCRCAELPLHRYSEPFVATQAYEGIDWYLLLSWKHVLSPQVVQLPRRGVVNLHYSLLPDYRGVYPVNWAIMEGRKESGITYHLVGEKIDAGPVLCQKTVPIRLDDTARSLQERMDDAAFETFDRVVEILAAGGDSLPVATAGDGSYRSGTDFEQSSELNLECEYRAGDLLNLLRGKTFLPESRNLYFLDPATGKRIYVSVSFSSDEHE